MCKSCLGEFSSPGVAAKWLRGQSERPVHSPFRTIGTWINADELHLPAEIQLRFKGGL